jgi:hypothetical protein
VTRVKEPVYIHERQCNRTRDAREAYRREDKSEAVRRVPRLAPSPGFHGNVRVQIIGRKRAPSFRWMGEACIVYCFRCGVIAARPSRRVVSRCTSTVSLIRRGKQRRNIASCRTVFSSNEITSPVCIYVHSAHVYDNVYGYALTWGTTGDFRPAIITG